MSVLALITDGICFAQLTDDDRSRLASQIASDIDSLNVATLPKLDQARSNALEAIGSVERYITAHATDENRQAWLQFLDWDRLRESLSAEDASVGTIARETIDLRFRLIGTSVGLELPAFADLRDSLESVIAAILFRDPDKAIALLSRQLQTLSDRTAKLNEAPTSNDVATISTLLSVIASSGQATGTLETFRSTFSRPNIAVRIRESLVRQVVRRDVNQVTPVSECILGTRIVGSANLTGIVDASLVPSTHSAKLLITLNGNVVSNNTGYNGPVRLRTAGFGEVFLSRLTDISDSGITMDTVDVEASLHNEVRRIEHNLALVRKIARRRVAKDKPKADRIALGRFRNRLSQQFTEQTDQGGSFKLRLLDKVRPMLKRLSLQEPTHRWSSTEDVLTIDTTFRLPDQITTVVPRPEIDEADYEVAMQIHESVINNAFSPILSGRTMNESEIDRLMESAGRPRAEEKNATQDEAPPANDDPPFEIDFARLQPVVFAARGQTIRVGVRGERFAQGRRELKRALEITAIYRPQKTDDGEIRLIRDKEIEVDFPGKRPLTISQAGIKPTIKRKFDDVFPETLLTREFKVPENAVIATLRDRVFVPTFVDANDGWVSVGFR